MPGKKNKKKTRDKDGNFDFKGEKVQGYVHVCLMKSNADGHQCNKTHRWPAMLILWWNWGEFRVWGGAGEADDKSIMCIEVQQ